MIKPRFLAISLAITGCTLASPLSHNGTLLLKPQITAGRLIQTQLPAYTQASINHLILKVYTYDGTEHDQNLQKTILNAQLGNSIVFANLKANTTYRIKAYAYATADESQLISTSDANSYTDIPLVQDDRPTISNLKVRLVDRDFNGQATASGVVVTSGNYDTSIPEGMAFLTPIGIVSTIAGNGNIGSQDGTGANALFNGPYGIAPDNLGNLYVADSENNRIRKITSAGVVSTFAGSTQGYADGTGTAALFYHPFALSLDAQGNIYVADTENNRIRKITSAGVVSTLAGSTQGYADGTGTAARLNRPYGITVTPSGTIYVGDLDNNLIRKITTAGVVSTVAGGGGATSSGYADGTGTAAKFLRPWGVGVDPQGNVYVADNNNHLIRKITTAGVVSTFAGSTPGFANGAGAAAKFTYPEELAVDSIGNVYVADNANHLIRKITPAGIVSTLAGGGGGTISGYVDGTGDAARFINPRAVAVDDSGHVYVGEYIAPRIRVIK